MDVAHSVVSVHMACLQDVCSTAHGTNSCTSFTADRKSAGTYLSWPSWRSLGREREVGGRFLRTPTEVHRSSYLSMPIGM